MTTPISGPPSIPGMSEFLVSAIVAFAFAGVCGCAPQVHSFMAEPNVICIGSSSKLTWAASTDGTLSSTPVVEPPRQVTANGGLSVAAATTTRFHLEVSNLFGSDGRDVDVSVLASPEVKVLGQSVADPSAGCDASNLWVTAVAPANFWDSRLKVGLVSSTDNRSYHLEHAGRVTDVTPGKPSNAFAGLDVSGPWRLVTPLAAGEACGHQTPPSLMIGVAAACQP